MLIVSIGPHVRLWRPAKRRVRKVQDQEGGRLTPQRCRHCGDGWMPACCLAHMTGNTSPSSSSLFYCHLSGRILAREAFLGVACCSGQMMHRSGPRMLLADAKVVHAVRETLERCWHESVPACLVTPQVTQAVSICIIASISYYTSEQTPFLLGPTYLRILVNSLSKPDVHLHSAGKRLIERLALRADRVIRPVCLRLCEDSIFSCRAEHIPFLLAPTFLRVLVNSLSKPDTHLHSAAKRLIEQLARHAESMSDTTLRVAVAVALQRQHGGGFDKLTKTKYATNLLKVFILLYSMYLHGMCNV